MRCHRSRQYSPPASLNAARDTVSWHARNNGVRERKLKLLRCPSNPASGDGSVDAGFFGNWGGSCYAVNAQVFAQVDPVTRRRGASNGERDPTGLGGAP